MVTKYNNLFSTFQIGNVKLKNRIALAPMAGTPVDENEYYIEIARGGVGLIVSGTTLVQNKVDVPAHIVFDHPAEFIEKRSLMLEKVHSYGTKMFIQLTAGLGRNLPASFAGGRQSVSASANLPNVWNPEEKTRELTIEEIREYLQAFAKAAKMSQMAGYDGVEIHAIHEGYLLDQFALSCCNHRTDQYGGSLENRARFAVEIMQTIKKVCGPNFPVGLRFSVRSYTKGFNQGAVPQESFVEFGRDLKEAVELAKYLEKSGFDFLNCDNGTYDSWYWSHPPMYMPEGLNVEDAAHIKAAVSIPVMVAGRLENPELAESVLESKKADMISIGRQLLADPQYPNKIKVDNYDDVKPCIACQIGCFGRIFLGKTRSCAVNPACGNERYHDLKPADKIKKIMIVGGGLAGMEAALIASKRGHKVNLYEKSSELGGVFIAAAAFDFKDADKRLIEWYKRQLTKSTVNIHLNAEVNTQLVSSEKPDAIIIATGAKERKLHIEGGERIIYAIDHLLKDKDCGQNVAIIGGGITGCEISYSLAKKGKNVSIIEILNETLPDRTLSAANRNCLKELMTYYKVNEYTNAKIEKITDNKIILIKGENKESIPADTVIAAVGYINENSLYTELLNYCGEVHILGDANKISNVLNAVWSANELASHI